MSSSGTTEYRTAAASRHWDSIQAIDAEVRGCQLCGLAGSRTKAVPGEGPAAPTVLFIGEGPGFNEDQQGRPFVGRAGQLLDELLASLQIQREDVFITNVVKCRPPDNREPAPDEVAACAPYLESQIRLLNPRVIVTLGRYSLATFFPQARISSEHGRILRWRGKVVLPLYHPAAALRSTSIKATLQADFKRIPEAVLEAIKGTQGPDATPFKPALMPHAAPVQPAAEDSVDSADDINTRGQLPLF